MSYNEQNLLVFLIVAVIIVLSYRDKPQVAAVIIVSLFVYAAITGRLPEQVTP